MGIREINKNKEILKEMLRVELKEFKDLRENYGIFGEIFALIYHFQVSLKLQNTFPRSHWSCAAFALWASRRGRGFNSKIREQYEKQMKITIK
jgi:hypothetical protein